MGYYVNGGGTVTFPKVREAELVQALKDLNHRHDLKRGHRTPKTGDPYEDCWYSWMPPRYHEDETLQTVSDMLEVVGFSVSEEDIGDMVTLRLYYEDKSGCEQLFIEALGRNSCVVETTWHGEDAESWQVSAEWGKVKVRNQLKSWGSWTELGDDYYDPIAASLHEYQNGLADEN